MFEFVESLLCLFWNLKKKKKKVLEGGWIDSVVGLGQGAIPNLPCSGAVTLIEILLAGTQLHSQGSNLSCTP